MPAATGSAGLFVGRLGRQGAPPGEFVDILGPSQSLHPPHGWSPVREGV